jgi:hypothetical protein
VKVTSLDLPSTPEALSVIREELPEDIEVTEVMTGLKCWTNPVNRFKIWRLHRSADPLKRTTEWIKATRAGMDTATWLREYELIWEALDGKPVYADEWSSEFHQSKSSLGWNPKLTVCRGWDFGLYPAVIFAQLFSQSRLMVLREAVGIDIDTERFTYEVSKLSSEWFPGAKFVEFIDPTGANRAGTDGRAFTQLLTKKPLYAKRIIRGANAPVQRRTAVIDFLKDNVKGLPCLFVDPSCEYLLKGFNGGYMYGYKNGTLKPKPEKNIFSHIHDGLQYLCSRVRSSDLGFSTSQIKITEPRFGKEKPTELSNVA